MKRREKTKKELAKSSEASERDFKFKRKIFMDFRPDAPRRAGVRGQLNFIPSPLYHFLKFLHKIHQYALTFFHFSWSFFLSKNLLKYKSKQKLWVNVMKNSVDEYLENKPNYHVKKYQWLWKLFCVKRSVNAEKLCYTVFFIKKIL